MSWKHNYPKLYRLLAGLRFSLARETLLALPFGAKMRINPFNFSERLIEQGDFEASRVAFFQRYIDAGTVFVDIGANVGFFTLLAGSSGATVHAFEPEPLNLRRLRANLQLNPEIERKTTVWPVALGDGEGEVQFGRPLSDNYGHASLLVDEGFEKIQVKMVSFGSLPIDAGTTRVFKIDVEGAESRVLEGFGPAWDVRVPTLFLVEVHRQYGADVEAIATRFEDKGFSVSYLDEESGNESASAPAQGDVALIARRDCV
jgi:FkbM family methyltransferase